MYIVSGKIILIQVTNVVSMSKYLDTTKLSIREIDRKVRDMIIKNHYSQKYGLSVVYDQDYIIQTELNISSLIWKMRN